MNKQNLLIVDDDPSILKCLKRELMPEGYSISTAASAPAGLDLIKDIEFGVILSDYMMPGMDGVTFLESVREFNPDAARIMLTGAGSLKNAMDAVNRCHIFAYLTKPWCANLMKKTIASAFEYYHLRSENERLQKITAEQNGLLKGMNENLEGLVRKRTRQLEEALRDGLTMLATAAEAKDDNTGDHIHRIQTITGEICLGLRLSMEESDLISFSSVMHDVGKIHITDSILNKPGPLADEEWQIMRTHTAAGERILGSKPFYETARRIARSHHERWDGSGYPDGLKADSIPLEARIVTVADVYDALTSDRPYKKAWPVEDALAEMKGLSGKLFDPEILKVFIRKFSEEKVDG